MCPVLHPDLQGFVAGLGVNLNVDPLPAVLDLPSVEAELPLNDVFCGSRWDDTSAGIVRHPELHVLAVLEHVHRPC